jgi:hypothetical protein
MEFACQLIQLHPIPACRMPRRISDWWECTSGYWCKFTSNPGVRTEASPAIANDLHKAQAFRQLSGVTAAVLVAASTGF